MFGGLVFKGRGCCFKIYLLIIKNYCKLFLNDNDYHYHIFYKANSFFKNIDDKNILEIL